MPPDVAHGEVCSGCASLAARVAALESLVAARPTGPAVEPGVLYTPREAADRLRCGLSSVYDLMQSGELAVTRTGTKKGFRVRGSDLAAFLASRTEGGPKPQGSLKHFSRWAS